MSMRAGVFVLTFGLLVVGARLAGSENLALVLCMSAAVAAIVATVSTTSGRHALRRIRRNSTRGWSLRSSD